MFILVQLADVPVGAEVDIITLPRARERGVEVVRSVDLLLKPQLKLAPAVRLDVRRELDGHLGRIRDGVKVSTRCVLPVRILLSFAERSGVRTGVMRVIV